MELPLALHGEYALTDVRRRIRVRGGRVADCPLCGGYLHEDDWHLAATLTRGPMAEDAVHHLCDDDCFDAWLGLLRPERTQGR